MEVKVTVITLIRRELPGLKPTQTISTAEKGLYFRTSMFWCFLIYGLCSIIILISLPEFRKNSTSKFCNTNYKPYHIYQDTYYYA